MVEITAPCTDKGRTASLDLVVALDTSGSMEGRKLDHVKQAAEFVIRKMGKRDTLTFVPFSSKAVRPSALAAAPMNANGKHQATHFVRALTAQGNTNIQDGLQTAVRILQGRRDKTGRAAGIFLMSDGEENIGNGREVHAHDFPVFTFGFGSDHDHHLLYDIAHKSHGGTYHNIPHSSDANKLLRYFAKVLGILRDVSALNLSVTLKPHAGATILEVDPGNHQVTSGGHGSFTIHFGELARKEQRRTIVMLQLPAVRNNDKANTVMVVECSYDLPDEWECRRSLHIDMARNRNASLNPPGGHFQGELARRDQADRIGKMKMLADAKRFDKALVELTEAKKALRTIDSTQDCADLLDALSLELEHLQQLLESHKVYNDNGSAYMLAAMLSHDRQRFAARGLENDVMLYALPRMLKYVSQADEFHRNPDATHFRRMDDESRGSIAFFTSYRPPVPLDIFYCPVPPSRKGGELHLTDGVSYNYNCRPIPQAAVKTIIKHLRQAPGAVVDDFDCDDDDEDYDNDGDDDDDSGRTAGFIFVSEREHGLETLHIALRSTAKSKVEVFSLADIYGSHLFGGARLEDSGCIAGGYEGDDGFRVDHYLVYVSTKEPMQERRSPWTVVYKTNLRTGQTERITPPGTSDLSPSVSPSGRKIAVASFQGKIWDGEINDLKTNIYVTSIDYPSRERRLVIENGGWPSWGSESVIFFHRKVGDTWGVFRYNLRSRETLRVTPEGFDAITPAAINETRVVVATIRQKSQFTDVRNENQYRHIEIFDMRAQPGQPPVQITQKTRPKADHFNPFVMDGGKYIGYHRCKSEHLQQGDDVERRFHKVQSPHEDVGVFRVSGAFPTFSKDGSKLAFVDNEFKAVWVADSQGVRVVFETNGPDSIFSPVWNQKKDILYVCMGPSFKANETLEIHAIPDVSSAANGRRLEPRLLTKGKFNNAFPFTNPDGTKFVFRSTRDGGDKNYKNLYIMEDAEFGEVGGGKVTRLTRGNWIDTHCQWSPDGKLIVFSSNRDKPADAPERDHGLDPGYFAVYLMNVSDRSVVRVIRSGYDLSGHVNHPVFSPDGRSIAVTSDLAAVSVDPMSLPTFLHSVRPYGDIFSVDIDPDDLEKNKDLERFDRVTHSRYENSTPAWTVFSTHDPHAQWNLEVMEDEYTPACPYAHRDGGESWHMTGQMCIPKRTC
ncbi:hypothetical protein U9M48_001041 [Paspalum notatum var. saurae]|uniref:VWFA domain-containing protein n=1 Tax=Paspalum notatum var. saurae TaxID=547442 RepID=A0AAQ3PFF8_PASNO